MKDIPNFMQFLNDANSVGSRFEQQIADNVQIWIEENSLDDTFNARRYQTVIEQDGKRDEDYSDVVVENLNTNEQIFIECKEHVNANIAQLMIDFEYENGKLKPIIVKGLNREKADNGIYRIFERFLSENIEFNEFGIFLNSEISISKKKFKPIDFYFNTKTCTDDELAMLISQYNGMVDNGNFSIKNKKFDVDTIRNSTKNMLVCGLLWRISDPKHTWDICHTRFSGPGFSKMIKEHYLNEKAVKVNYIQFGENAFYRFNEENPLSIDCEIFPKELSGKFDLKFTPRFGTGAMYITSRSSITQKLATKSSFGNNENNWPKYLG